MAYNGNENNKFAPEDFASIEAIDEWWPKYIENNKEKDSDGYTPLGAAVLNSAPLECIAHIMELYTFNKPKTNNDQDDPFIDVANDISKGRSPIGVACLAMNADAVDVLRSNYYEYILKDEDNNPIPKLDHYGDPINAEKYVMYTSVPLWDEYTKESYKYNKVQQITKGFSSNFPSQQFPNGLQYKSCKDTDTDWLAAAALPKADILIKLIPKATSDADKHNYNDILDDSGNTLILLACVADCHESVVYLRDNCSNFNDIATINYEENPDQIFIKNNDDLTAFDVALESPDTDLLPLLLGDQDIADFIDKLLIAYFHEKADKKINKVLIKLITTENIYDYYVKEDIDGQPNKYDYGHPDDPDTIQYYIIEYIEKENNTSLFKLLLPKYNDPENSYEEHLDTFFSNMCSRIIAFLYRKSYIPFNNTNPTENLNNLLDFHNNELYDDIVEILFKGGFITLKQICDIDSSREDKRNKCIDKIFAGSYNKQLFIQLLLVDSDNKNKNDILVYLYNNDYFTLQNIAELSGDSDLNKDNDFLFDIIYELVGNNIATVDSEINNTYNTFKVNYCVYLYKNERITIGSIVDSECNSVFKCNIINTLYYNAMHNIEEGKLKLEDIYYIYNHYNDTLSDLHNDLRPLIGYMKYCENDSITSDFFWAYNFSNHSSAHWRNPQKSYVDIPPITDNDLVTVSSSSPRYKQVKIVDATGSVLPRNPNKFRLGVYNYKPEFEIDSVYNVTSNQNAMIVAFGSDINSINSSINTNIPLPSSSDALYSITDGTYLGESVKIINWITTNSLYAALNSQQCYSKNSNELPAIDSLEFTKGAYQGSDITVPPKVTAIHNTHWNLPSVSGGTYTDTEGIKYEATSWKIGSTTYNFGDEYVFNDNNVVAQLEFAKVAVTLTYQKSNYITLDFILPAAVPAHSGDSITLATFSSQYYYNTSGIKYEAKKWTINSEQYDPGSSFIIKDNTIAELKCDIASVTITYTKPADVTLYNESGNEVTWPSAITRNSGTTITLASLSNTYYNADRTKTYTLTGWKIGSANYNFGAIYALKDNTTASLQYTENTVSVSIWCNVDFNVPASVTEGNDGISRSFKLSHQPTANVTLNISSTVANRLYIGDSASSISDSITLTFTTLNWNNAQVVYFRAKDDSDVNGDVNGVVNIQASSTGDNRYNNLSESFNITVKDNDSESIGKFAFASGYFAVDLEPNYKMPKIQDLGAAYRPLHNTTDEYMVMVKDQWQSMYTSEHDYEIYQMPKSSNADPFEYNRIFNTSIIFDE